MFSPNRKPDPAVPGIGFTASPRSSEMEQLLMRLQSMIETSRLLRHILNDESREGQSDQFYKSHSGSFDDCKYLSSKNILVTDFSVSSVRVVMMSVRCAADTLAWLQINYHPQPALTPPSHDHEMRRESFLILSSNEYSISSYHFSPHAFA